MAFTLTSRAFTHQGTMPTSCTCDGADSSPPLAWTDPPTGTKSFALITDDPDAPVGAWVHWILYNVPAERRSLTERLPATETLADGARQGLNTFRRIGYGGPCPPPGPAHRYVFTLYALDTLLTLPPKSTKAQVERAMAGHTLARTELIGLFQRDMSLREMNGRATR